MKTFDTTIHHHSVQIHVIEPMDKYGEGKMHFSEIPLVEIKPEHKSATCIGIGEFLTATRITLHNGSEIDGQALQDIQQKILKAFPENYLKLFISLAKHQKNKM